MHAEFSAFIQFPFQDKKRASSLFLFFLLVNLFNPMMTLPLALFQAHVIRTPPPFTPIMFQYCSGLKYQQIPFMQQFPAFPFQAPSIPMSNLQDEFTSDEIEVLTTLSCFPELHKKQEQSRLRKEKTRLRQAQRREEKKRMEAEGIFEPPQKKEKQQKQPRGGKKTDHVQVKEEEEIVLEYPCETAEQRKLFIENDYSIHIKMEIKEEVIDTDTSPSTVDTPPAAKSTFPEQLLEGNFTSNFFNQLFS